MEAGVEVGALSWVPPEGSVGNGWPLGSVTYSSVLDWACPGEGVEEGGGV